MLRLLLVLFLLLETAPLPLGGAEAPEGKVVRIEHRLAHPRKSKDERVGDAGVLPASVFLPEGREVLRGLVLNPFYEKAVEQERWRTAAAHWGFGVVGTNLFGVRREHMAESLLAALAELARESGHPEIAHAPLCLVGMSAGGGMCATLCTLMPERVLAAAPVCLEVGPQDEAAMRVPMLTIFGERDGKQMEKLSEKLPLARAEDAQWGIAVQWGRKHEFHLAANLVIPFFDAVIRERYPLDGTPLRGPLDLRPYPADRVWLGEKEVWGESAVRLHELGGSRDLPFDPVRACWLPDANTAAVWQAFVVKKPRLKIKSPPGLGGGQEFLVHAAGEPIEVEVTVAGDLVLEEIAVFDGAEELAKGAAEVRTLRLPPLAAGPHALIVVGTDAKGERHLSAPHTILVSSID